MSTSLEEGEEGSEGVEGSVGEVVVHLGVRDEQLV